MHLTQLALLSLLSATLLSQKELLLVLMRHGPRTGSRSEKDQNKKGRLTGNGLRMCYLNGVYIRKNYKRLFEDGYSPENNKVISSSSLRCKMCARATM